MEWSLPLLTISASTAVSSIGLLLIKRSIEQAFDRRLEVHKAALQGSLDKQRIDFEATVKQRVETFLADEAADREYKLEARKRLHLAIGPIRFQLLLACRDLAGRIEAHGTRKRWPITINNYYGRSTLSRFLRPLALAELAEREIAFFDFSVDSGAVDLIRFKRRAFAIFTGPHLVKGHPSVNWEDEEQHIFYDNLARAAAAFIVQPSDAPARCMRADEWERALGCRETLDATASVLNLFARFSPEATPLFWARLIAYALLCNDYVNSHGKAAGFEKRALPLSILLKASGDRTILSNLDEYERRCNFVLSGAL